MRFADCFPAFLCVYIIDIVMLYNDDVWSRNVCVCVAMSIWNWAPCPFNLWLYARSNLKMLYSIHMEQAAHTKIHFFFISSISLFWFIPSFLFLFLSLSQSIVFALCLHLIIIWYIVAGNKLTKIRERDRQRDPHLFSHTWKLFPLFFAHCTNREALLLWLSCCFFIASFIGCFVNAYVVRKYCHITP